MCKWIKTSLFIHNCNALSLKRFQPFLIRFGQEKVSHSEYFPSFLIRQILKYLTIYQIHNSKFLLKISKIHSHVQVVEQILLLLLLSWLLLLLSLSLWHTGIVLLETFFLQMQNITYINYNIILEEASK